MGYPEINICAAPTGTEEVHRFVFVLCPGFSSLDLGAGLDSLEAANDVLSKTVFEWEIASEAGDQVRASSGLTVAVERTLPPTRKGDCVVIFGPTTTTEPPSKRLIAWLREAKRFGAALCGVGGGAIILAQAQLTSGHPVSAHWSIQSAVAEAFLDLDVRCSVFEQGGNATTSAGGAATLDLFLALIAERLGTQTAARVADQLLCSTVRSGTDRQTRSDLCRLGTRHERLGKAILHMEENFGSDLSPSHVAAIVGLSTRQLERLFLRYVGSSPKVYITTLRLERARLLLQQTNLRVIDVAMDCGFTSASHFSKLYRKHWGISPNVERGAP